MCLCRLFQGTRHAELVALDKMLLNGMYSESIVAECDLYVRYTFV